MYFLSKHQEFNLDNVVILMYYCNLNMNLSFIYFEEISFHIPYLNPFEYQIQKKHEESHESPSWRSNS